MEPRGLANKPRTISTLCPSRFWHQTAPLPLSAPPRLIVVAFSR